jgi:hypothetical protein
VTRPATTGEPGAARGGLPGAGEDGLADLLADVREDLAHSPGAVDVPRVARLLRARGRVLGAAATLALTARVRDHVDGLGPLQGLVAPGVTDLLVNDDGTVWVDDADGLRRAGLRLGADEARELAAGSTTPCPGPMRTFPPASASTRCCRRSPPAGRSSRCACPRASAWASTTSSASAP